MRPITLIALVALPLQAQTAIPLWTMSARPTLDIGDESNTQTQFNGVTGIVRMPGGAIVIANGLSQELRVFSATGGYMKTLTSENRGLVLRSLDRIWRGGDTIYVAEVLPTESAVWSFTLDGSVKRNPVGASNAGGIMPVDRFPDGRLVITAAPRRTAPPNVQSAVDSAPIGTLSLSSIANPKWIGWLKNETVLVPGAGGPGRGRGGGQGRVREQYLYGRSFSYAVSGDRLWIGDSETGTITQHSSTGRGLMVFAAPTPARSLDTAAIRRRRAALLSAVNWDDRSRSELWHPVPAGKRTAPRFSRFVPGMDGEMWIEQFREDPSFARSYVVVDRAGTPIGRVTMPDRTVPLSIGATDVLGVFTDSEGLEHVVRHALRRTPR